jgi:formylglycine-generating enzyme required for sulfatase activity
MGRARRVNKFVIAVVLITFFMVLQLVIFKFVVAPRDSKRHASVAQPGNRQLDLNVFAPEMVYIRGGKFMMGTLEDSLSYDYHNDELPLEVSVEDFAIGKYPVTAREMCIFLNSPEASQLASIELYDHGDVDGRPLSTIKYENGRYIPRLGAKNAPANQVTWLGAAHYCEWLAKRTERPFRLPTEAEWEYAALDENSKKWPWGGAKPGPQHGIRYDPAHQSRRNWPVTPVGSYPANTTLNGVSDMLGYFFGEWCVTKYVANPDSGQVLNKNADTQDVYAPKVLRGVYKRRQKTAEEYHFRNMQPGDHYGTSWTRMGLNPFQTPEQSTGNGFRIVEDIPPKP